MGRAKRRRRTIHSGSGSHHRTHFRSCACGQSVFARRSSQSALDNVQEDIENALLMLGYKVRQAAIQIERRYETDLPTIQAMARNFSRSGPTSIDNAVDALEGSTPPRRLEVRAASDGDS